MLFAEDGRDGEIEEGRRNRYGGKLAQFIFKVRAGLDDIRGSQGRKMRFRILENGAEINGAARDKKKVVSCRRNFHLFE